MKRVLTGILALSSALLLASCGDKTTTQKRTTASQKTTTKKFTTQKATTKIKTTEKPVEYVNRLRFFCSNNEFKNIIDNYYSQTDKFDEEKTYLHDGTIIEWIFSPNYKYTESLETALETCNCDMFTFEANYAPKYINTNMVVDLEEEIEDYDTSKQVKAVKDAVTYNNCLKGAAWLATPGVTVYNQNVADKVWGEWNGDELVKGVTYSEVEKYLSTKEKFDAAAAEVYAKGFNMLIEPLTWLEVYRCNMNSIMYDDFGTTKTSDDEIVIDQKLFDWVNDSKRYLNSGYMYSADYDYTKWSQLWAGTISLDNWLCIFSPTWMNESVLKGNRHASDEDPAKMTVREMKDSKLRLVKTYDSWIENGAWIGVSDCGIANPAIYDSICNIVKETTSNKDFQKNVAQNPDLQIVPNNMDALYELANDDTNTTSYFGGQNLFSVYAKAVLRTDLSNRSFYDQTIVENFTSEFLRYLQTEKTAEEAWNSLKNSLKDKLKIDKNNIFLPDEKTSIDDVIL